MPVGDIDKRYLWRCRGNCQKQPPYFGFIWVKENREPNPMDDSMWVNLNDGCDHEFERYGDDPKQWRTEWECIMIFNEFITTNQIRIRSKQINAIEFTERSNGNRNEDFFVIDIVDETEEISNNQYVNYDVKSGTFINLAKLYSNLYADLDEPNCTVCIVCFHAVNRKSVIEHLRTCTGLTFTMNESNLPVIMINN